MTATTPTRRAVLAGAAAAPAAAALPTLATPADPDAALIAAFLEWRACCAYLIDANEDGLNRSDADYDAACRREEASGDILDDVPAQSPTGIILKLARLIYSAGDRGQINDPTSPARRLLASLDASRASLPPVVVDAVALAVEQTSISMRRWDDQSTRLYHIQSELRRLAGG